MPWGEGKYEPRQDKMPSDEDRKVSRGINIKTDQGSEDKNNVKKAVLQQHHSWQTAANSPEDLTGATFSALRPATFNKAIKRLSGFATLKYGHYTCQAFQTRQPNIFSHPTKPSDDDITNNTDGSKYWWEAEFKEIMAEKRTYTSNLCKMFPTVLGCCDEDLQGKVRNRSDFNYLESSGDTLGLPNGIEQEGYGIRRAKYTPVAYHQEQFKLYQLRQGRAGRSHTMYDHLEHHSDMDDMTEHAAGKLDGVPASIVATPDTRSLCGFFLQILHKDVKPDNISNYGNPILAEFQAINNDDYKSPLIVSTILSLERSI